MTETTARQDTQEVLRNYMVPIEMDTMVTPAIRKDRIARAGMKMLAFVGAGSIGANLALSLGAARFTAIAVGVCVSVTIALVGRWLMSARRRVEEALLAAIGEQTKEWKIGWLGWPTLQEEHDTYTQLHKLWVKAALLAPTWLHAMACSHLASHYMTRALPIRRQLSQEAGRAQQREHLVSKFEHRNHAVDAIQWKGDNFADVQEFFSQFYDLDAIGLREFTGRYYDADNVPQLAVCAWDEEEETVPLGEWIVIETPPGEQDGDEVDHYGYGRTMGESAFAHQYRPAGPPPPVAGFCPMGCGQTLHLAAGAVVTCSSGTCPQPTAAADLLTGQTVAHTGIPIRQ